MSFFINFNGDLLAADTPIAGAANRGLRYGDGLFETILWTEGGMPYFELHLNRLFEGLQAFHYTIPAHFDAHYLEQQINRLIRKNKCSGAVRIRLSVFRGDGGVYDPVNLYPNWVIETYPMASHTIELNENGLIAGIFSGAIKAADAFSQYKSANYQPYLLAAFYAKQQKWNEALVLNQWGRICDASIANVFWVESGRVYTPALSEGGIAGVMRAHLIKHSGTIEEEVLPVERLMNAEAVFLTNAVRGIRWVKQVGDREYALNDFLKYYYKLKLLL